MIDNRLPKKMKGRRKMGRPTLTWTQDITQRRRERGVEDGATEDRDRSRGPISTLNGYRKLCET